MYSNEDEYPLIIPILLRTTYKVLCVGEINTSAWDGKIIDVVCGEGRNQSLRSGA